MLIAFAGPGLSALDVRRPVRRLDRLRILPLTEAEAARVANKVMPYLR